jgi:hypothetical protein
VNEELAGAVWRKSRRSNGQANCVEVAFLADGQVAVRNSRDPRGSVLIFTAGEWNAFAGGVADGEFVAPGTSGYA